MGKKKSSTRRSAGSAQESSKKEASALPAVLASSRRLWNKVVQQVAQLASGPAAACFQGHQLDSVCEKIFVLASEIIQQAAHLDGASSARQLQQLSVSFSQLQLPQLLVKLLRARKGARDWQQHEYSSSIGNVLKGTVQLFNAASSLDGGLGQAAQGLVTPEVLAESITAQEELALLLQEQQQEEQQQEHQPASALLWMSIHLLYWWQTADRLSIKDVPEGVHAQALSLPMQPAAALTLQVAQGMLGSSSTRTEYVAVLLAAHRVLLHVEECLSKQLSTGDASPDTQHPAFLHLMLMEVTIYLHKLQCLTATVVGQPSCSEVDGCSQGVGHSSSSPSSSPGSSSSNSSHGICADGSSSSSSSSSGASSLSSARTATSAAAACVPQASLLHDLILQVWQALGMSPAALPCFSDALDSTNILGLSCSASSQAQTVAGQLTAKCTGAMCANCAFFTALRCMSNMLYVLRGGDSSRAESASSIWGQLSVQHQQLLQAVSWLMPPLLMGTAVQYCHDDAQAVKAAQLLVGVPEQFMEYWGLIEVQSSSSAAGGPAAAAAAAADEAHPSSAGCGPAAAADAGAGSVAEHTARVLLSATLHSCLLLLKKQLTGSGCLAALASKDCDTSSNSSSNDSNNNNNSCGSRSSGSSRSITDYSNSAVAGCDSITLTCRHADFVYVFLSAICRAAQEAGGSWAAAVWASQSGSIMAMLELMMRRVHCCKFVCDGNCGNKQVHRQQQQQKPELLQQPLQQEQQRQPVQQEQQQQLCEMQVAGVACKVVDRLHGLLVLTADRLFRAYTTMVTTGPCGPVPWAGWQQQQQRQVFSLVVSCIKLFRISRTSDYFRNNLHCSSLAAAEVIRALSKSDNWCSSSLQQRQAALAPLGMLYGLIFIELGLILETVRTEAEQLPHSSGSDAGRPKLEGDCGVVVCDAVEDSLTIALEAVQNDMKEVCELAEAFQSTFCQVWSLDGDQLGQATGQEVLQHQQRRFHQQQQMEQEKAGCTAASAAPGLPATGAAMPRYDLASALFLRHENVVATARQAVAAVQAARTSVSHTSNEGSQPPQYCSSDSNIGSQTSHGHAGSSNSDDYESSGASSTIISSNSASSSHAPGSGSGSGGEPTTTAVGSAATRSCSIGDEGHAIAAAQSARSQDEVLSVLLQCPAFSELQQLLQETGEALCVSLPVPWLCNNPSCTNLACSSEQLLVGGKGCVCGSCRVARYCGRACQAAHWKRHKPVCRRMAAEAAAGDDRSRSESSGSRGSGCSR